ncbi:undecaprenyldiphospho-muramoylpentapeptide beta-N-acetylglucosaminyltransferase [Stutzerimonas kirkiae]|uniref:UDP-N-acetylglucosamine--N-acetylmuramyl-(pentapeptide) pyrophosphoryl-undecaprenol N-acetylglucosamine transferase n=1 Tax=Stutzerimonas kirkiae TaxID=2211392 RepID=A0A4V2KD34_9GAMM|nr:undecaprenyldiphospho-muramoylpentapeptide beta-N-acetylglucosaminyltransferase [Stutzerimonas kirkiae]TBU97312.1 undecaprenyldiphospho-muramoylpentapeptide beta-N-acetylglucosaminyltransferase [Stutzerimonas kirkiae]TBV02944.1 undecaprenyldiphospho-muramoylpentapeptide beta-N-acetylglucosaminyltransferase [Stutzerimonas kirkiae]TBV06659.1 undecaprenyldiphospho-muramoylpentapeptide beta-N-acetylglucosaminyltransferase [Stutzerimonas kirkiae]TBV13045.1 undecaprenyldiphospho-muramoylpentapepti
MAASILIMAGGTGGHVFPALACAEEFRARGYQVHWLGTPRGIENELVPAAGLPLHRIEITGLRGKGALSLLKAPLQLLRSLLQARRVIRDVRPVCVLGLGGYVTGPGGLAARLAGVPLVIHEQNAVAGTANRALSSFAQRVCEAFPDTFVASDKRRTTGNPVRRELFQGTPRAALEGRRAQLLVLGGSLGAEPLNKLLPQALAQVAPELRPEVFHQAGKQHAEITRERYAAVQVAAEVEPFINDMAKAYAWADLVICRAGALTVSELAAAGLPSLLVPLPHAIDDHQTRNAEYLAKEGAAILLPQAKTDASRLAAQLTEVMMQPERLEAMGASARRLARPDATAKVVDICLEVANG